MADTFDNATVHYYPMSPYIAKCDVHLRLGGKIVLRTVVKDLQAAGLFLERFPDIPVKTYVHM